MTLGANEKKRVQIVPSPSDGVKFFYRRTESALLLAGQATLDCHPTVNRTGFFRSSSKRVRGVRTADAVRGSVLSDANQLETGIVAALKR